MHQDLFSRLRLRAALAFASFGLVALAQAADRPPVDTDAFREALSACAAEQGLPPPPAPGERPPGEGSSKQKKRPDRAKFDQCMSAKGFAPPTGGKRPPRDDEDDGVW